MIILEREKCRQKGLSHATVPNLHHPGSRCAYHRYHRLCRFTQGDSEKPNTRCRAGSPRA